jgi:hypothetical protein
MVASHIRIQGTLYWVPDSLAGRTYLREIGSLVQERVHGINNGTNIPLRAQTANTILSGLIGELTGEMNGDHQDGNFRMKLRDLPGHFNPVKIGHLEIEQDHVGRIFPNSLQGFCSGWSEVAYTPGTFQFEERTKIISHRRVVIRHKNSDQAEPFLSLLVFPCGAGDLNEHDYLASITISGHGERCCNTVNPRGVAMAISAGSPRMCRHSARTFLAHRCPGKPSRTLFLGNKRSRNLTFAL